MGRYYFHSIRVAAWVWCALLGIMVYFYQNAPGDPHSLAYTRVWQFYKLAFAVVVALPIVQAMRAGGATVYGRLETPSGRTWLDRWAAQIWGPLMLENLAYGAWLLLVLAFFWRYQSRLPVPEPWQGNHPPMSGPSMSALLWLGKLYLSGLALTVAGAYANLYRIGSMVLPLWGALSIVLPVPAAALAVLGFTRVLGFAPVPEPGESPRRSLFSLFVMTAGCLLLAAVLVPNFIRAGTRGNLTGCKSNLKNIGTALEMYSTDNEGRYPTSPAQLMPNYLKTIPTCSSVGWVTYKFQTASDPDLYTVVCGGRNHEGTGIHVDNFPQYTSVLGLTERP